MLLYKDSHDELCSIVCGICKKIDDGDLPEASLATSDPCRQSLLLIFSIICQMLPNVNYVSLTRNTRLLTNFFCLKNCGRGFFIDKYHVRPCDCFEEDFNGWECLRVGLMLMLGCARLSSKPAASNQSTTMENHNHYSNQSKRLSIIILKFKQ